MTLRRSSHAAAAILVLVSLAGCQPLHFDNAYDVGPQDTQIIEFDPPSYSQKLKVEISSPGAPVTAYAVKATEKATAQQELDRKTTPANNLGGQESSETIAFDMSIPSKTGFTILVKNRGSKSAHVQVKVNGR